MISYKIFLASFLLAGTGCVAAHDKNNEVIDKIIHNRSDFDRKIGGDYKFVGFLEVSGEFKLRPSKSIIKDGYRECISGLYGIPGLYEKFRKYDGRKVEILGVLAAYKDGIVIGGGDILIGKDFTFFENTCGGNFVIIAKSIKSY